VFILPGAFRAASAKEAIAAAALTASACVRVWVRERESVCV